MGNTRVMAAVFGPRPADRRGDESHDRATVRCEFIQAPFATGERRKRGKGDRRAVETASLVKDTLEATVLTELHPRSVIDVHVLVVQADGGVRACCINAVSLAVADASCIKQGLNARHCTDSLWLYLRMPSASDVQMMMVLSAPPDANLDPSKLHDTAYTASL